LRDIPCINWDRYIKSNLLVVSRLPEIIKLRPDSKENKTDLLRSRIIVISKVFRENVLFKKCDQESLKYEKF
jgi:hypothetical protein